MSDRTNRVFTTEYKEQAVLRLEAGEQFSALAAELGVRRKLLYDWRKAWRLSPLRSGGGSARVHAIQSDLEQIVEFMRSRAV